MILISKKNNINIILFYYAILFNTANIWEGQTLKKHFFKKQKIDRYI